MDLIQKKMTDLMSKEAMQKIWSEVKANHDLLASCVGPHDFLPLPGRAFGAKNKCSKCGGQVESNAAHWYKLGLEHRK